MPFKSIPSLSANVETAFQVFYDEMLKDERLNIFFDSEQQVLDLIVKQKQFFIDSINLPKKDLYLRFEKLGEVHYDLRIPYVDFIKGSEILEESFLLYAQEHAPSTAILHEIFAFFKIMTSYTAKGYLNRMIREDKADIALLLDGLDLHSDDPFRNSVISKKINWLNLLLDAIEQDLELDAKEYDTHLINWDEETPYSDLAKTKKYIEMEERISCNAQNLFYFLKRKDYLEILPLYSSLLSIYKLTFIISNSLTVEYANRVISDLQIDKHSKLYRKDVFQDVLNSEISYVKRRTDYYFSLVYIDIDDFKQVNDEYGHYSGDIVIEQLGEIIRNNMRSTDMGFRVGGDEFALILKNARAEQSKRLAEKILHTFANRRFRFNDEISFTVELSIGIAEYTKKTELSLKDFMVKTDNLLYQAKQSGKNQICHDGKDSQ